MRILPLDLNCRKSFYAQPLVKEPRDIVLPPILAKLRFYGRLGICDGLNTTHDSLQIVAAVLMITSYWLACAVNLLSPRLSLLRAEFLDNS